MNSENKYQWWRWPLVPFAAVAGWCGGNLLAFLFQADLLLYAFGPFCAVYFGGSTAPSQKKVTAIVIATLVGLLMGLGSFGFFYEGKWVKGILSVIGFGGVIFGVSCIEEKS